MDQTQLQLRNVFSACDGFCGCPLSCKLSLSYTRPLFSYLGTSNTEHLTAVFIDYKLVLVIKDS